MADEIFAAGDMIQQGATVDGSVDSNKAAKAEKIAAMKQALKTAMEQDPTLASKFRTASDTIEVVNTLGYGDGGNIVVDKAAKQNAAAKGAEDRKLVPTSKIVGYKVRNCGTEPISYDAEIWTKGADGIYTSSTETRTMQPGQVVNMTRVTLTLLTCRPEFDFTLRNGKIVSSSASSKAGKGDIQAELARYYFSFNSEEKKEVNGDDVKLRIDDGGTVLPEYAEVFGFLNNPKPSKKASRKGAGSNVTVQDMAANYVRMLLEKQGSL